MNKLITLFIALFIGIAAYSQTVTDYTTLLKGKGYTYNVAPTSTESALKDRDGKYLVLIHSDANSDNINDITVVVILDGVKARSATNFNNVEPIALYRSKWRDLSVQDGIISTFEDGRVQITLLYFK